MRLLKYLLIGVCITSANVALAQATKATPIPSAETILTPGARLVVGASPDIDFSILDANDEAQTKAAAPLPHHDTNTSATVKPAPVVVTSKPTAAQQRNHKHLVQRKTHRHLFTHVAAKKRTHHQLVAAVSARKMKHKLASKKIPAGVKLASNESH